MPPLFITPFTMLIAAPTSSGKTVWIKKLLENQHLFSQRPSYVYYFYAEWQPLFTEMESQGLVDEFIEGIVDLEFIRDECKNRPNALVICDDNILKITEEHSEIFSVSSHHLNCNVIFVSQMLFSKNRFLRDLSVNSTYLVLMKNPRDGKSVRTLAGQIEPTNPDYIIDSYMQATKSSYSYLIIDLHQKTNGDERLRSNIFNENNLPIHVYVKKSK